jgi:hypothetical protein
MHPIFQALAALRIRVYVWEMTESIRIALLKHLKGGESSSKSPKIASPVRRPRTDAHIAAFEKARAKRAANLIAGGVTSPMPPISPPPAHAAAPPAPAAPPKRKTRSIKGAKRGYLVKEDMAGDYHLPKGSSEGDMGEILPPNMNRHVAAK